MAKTEVKGQESFTCSGKGEGVEYLLNGNPKVPHRPSVSLTVLCLDIERVAESRRHIYMIITEIFPDNSDFSEESF